jgi:hypothetical protein
MIAATFDSTEPLLHNLLARTDNERILRLHCIAPGGLRADRFWERYVPRAEMLLHWMEAATGKSITHEPELFSAGGVAEASDEGPEEWDAQESLEEAAS